MEAVDILVGVDRRDDPLLVDMVGQRQLDEDAVDRIVGVELVDQIDQLLLADRRIAAIFEALHPRLDRRLVLRSDIDLARRVLADEDDRKARRAPGGGAERRDQFPDSGAQIGRECLAVDDVRAHARSSMILVRAAVSFAGSPDI